MLHKHFESLFFFGLVNLWITTQSQSEMIPLENYPEESNSHTKPELYSANFSSTTAPLYSPLNKPLEISNLFFTSSPEQSLPAVAGVNNLTDDELRSLLLSQPQQQYAYSGSGQVSQCDPMTNVYPCGSLEFIGCAGNKKYYAESIIRLNWYEAWEYCRTHGMHLASIETRYEQTFLEVFLPRPELVEKPTYWLSGTDFGREGLFIWMSSGRSFTYTNWQRSEPNNRQGREHCVQMEAVGPDFEKFRWNDHKCSSVALAICQKEYYHNLETIQVHQQQQPINTGIGSITSGSSNINTRPAEHYQNDQVVPVLGSYRPKPAVVIEGVPHNLKKKKNAINKRKRTKPRELIEAENEMMNHYQERRTN